MLIQRIITGSILLLITLLGDFFLSPVLFTVIISLVLLWAGFEWCQFIGLTTITVKIAYLVLLSLILLATLVIPIHIMLWLALFIWLLFFSLIMAYNFDLSMSQWLLKYSFCRALMGILTLIPAWLSFHHIFYMENGREILLFLLAIVAFSDIGAYFLGKYLGKNKLLPKVSPNKTWEGVYGSLGVVFLLALLVIYSASPMTLANSFAIILLTLVVAIVSIIGDLFESMLKRFTGIKDSGHFLPGHGGILDRIDGLLVATPIFLLLMLYMGLSDILAK